MKVLLLLVFSFFAGQAWAVDSLIVSSPDGKIEVIIHHSGKLQYSVNYEGSNIIQPSSINLLLENKKDLLKDLRISRSTLHSVNDLVISPVPEKRKVIPNHYNELRIDFKQPFSLVFRVYND